MTVIALGSVSGSPGTTSLVLALASVWPRRVLVVEADPDGGRLAARCDLAARPGLTELAAATRGGSSVTPDVWRCAQTTTDGIDVVVAHPAAETVASALRAGAGPIGQVLSALGVAVSHEVDDAGVDVLLDVGRLRPSSPAIPLVERADRRIVVTGTRFEDAVVLVHRADLLDALGGVDLVVCAGGDHTSRELAAATGRTVLSSRPGRRSARQGRLIRRREERWLLRVAEDLARHHDVRPDDAHDAAIGPEPDVGADTRPEAVGVSHELDADPDADPAPARRRRSRLTTEPAT